ncbi:copper-translocating P-type ATPase [Aerococcus loyolae]|uniref:P-type Cu(+) transporter n=2 Tax=Aerococcaceae TaxID=186827 RepID=A0A2I1L6T0_9LACT|nr:ATPase [Aerococcus loyolae]PKY85709.1 copper-translocating P-type ATPase [Aerococcus loyolae]PKZ03574.1 copper-translocating P-type ATPase [Aerococcus loyolae]RAV81479.1 copper-translocating P-type ATPase [Aerococcus loyolae]
MKPIEKERMNEMTTACLNACPHACRQGARCTCQEQSCGGHESQESVRSNQQAGAKSYSQAADHHHHEAASCHSDAGHGDHASHADHQGHGGHHMGMMADMQERFWVVLVLTLPIAVLSPMLMMIFNYSITFPGQGWVEFLLGTIVFFYGGKPFLEHGWMEIQNKQPGMMLLITLGIVSSYLYSVLTTFFLDASMNYYFELATLILIMLLGHVIEMKSQMRANDDLESLANLLPNEASRITADGEIEVVAIDQLQVDDRVLVRPGEKVAVDGVIVSGHSSLDEAVITGESVPVSKEDGDQVIAGTINGDGALQVRVAKAGADSYVQQVLDLVKGAQAQKSKAQSLADRVAAWLFYIAFGIGVIALAIWWNLTTAATAIQFMVSTFVIACPHALGLAIPLVNAKSTSLAARSGLLVQNRIPFEQAYQVDTVVFDKTGTLTKGEFAVDGIYPLAGHSEDQVLTLAASLEQQSEHPIAKGIVKAAQGKEVKLKAVTDYHNHSGAGLEGRIDGDLVQILSPKATRQAGYDYDPRQLEKITKQAKTVVFVIQADQVIGALAVSDQVRPEAKAVIQELHDQGVEAVMLTGDNDQVAQAVAKEIGLDQVFSQVLPDQKSAAIQSLQNQGKSVMMVGDGVNDAPALAQAQVGVAIGAGTDVAMDSADIILVESQLKDVLNSLSLSQATNTKIKQNLAWGAGYNIFAIPLAAGLLAPLGLTLGPALSGILMSLSTVICAVNAQSLNFEKYD